MARRAFPTKPPSVEYELTELGQSALGLLSVLLDWAESRFSEIEAARARHDWAAQAS